MPGAGWKTPGAGALEPSHALAQVMKLAPKLPKDNLLVVNVSGRGDKDLFTVAKHLGMKI